MLIVTTRPPPAAEAGAPEITPAMIDAGIDAYCALDREFDSFERIVRDIYLVMEAARLQPPTCASVSSRQLVRQSDW